MLQNPGRGLQEPHAYGGVPDGTQPAPPPPRAPPPPHPGPATPAIRITPLIRCPPLRYPTRVLQAATARLDFNAMLLLQLAIDPSNLPPSAAAPIPATQEPGMLLVPPRLLQDGSRCVGMQQAIAAPKGITPPQDRITLQMLMQRARVPP